MQLKQFLVGAVVITFLLAARMGLRTIDIKHLKLDNLKWQDNRIELIPEPKSKGESVNNTQKASNYDTVFVVHGSDESVKEKVARFLEKLKLKPIAFPK